MDEKSCASLSYLKFVLTGFRQTSTLFNICDHNSKRCWVHTITRPILHRWTSIENSFFCHFHSGCFIVSIVPGGSPYLFIRGSALWGAIFTPVYCKLPCAEARRLIPSSRDWTAPVGTYHTTICPEGCLSSFLHGQCLGCSGYIPSRTHVEEDCWRLARSSGVLSMSTLEQIEIVAQRKNILAVMCSWPFYSFNILKEFYVGTRKLSNVHLQISLNRLASDN